MTVKRREDRRIRRTRRLLQDALIGLLRRKPLAKIRIKEIVEDADVSRPTFYHHFATKEELLFSLVDDLFDLIRADVHEHHVPDHSKHIRHAMVASFEHWIRHGEKLRWVFQVENRDLLISALVPHVESLRMQLDQHFTSAELVNPYEDYVTVFMAGGLYMMLKRWIDEGMRESAETMGTMLLLLVDHGFAPMRRRAAANPDYREAWMSEWKASAGALGADGG